MCMVQKKNINIQDTDTSRTFSQTTSKVVKGTRVQDTLSRTFEYDSPGIPAVGDWCSYCDARTIEAGLHKLTVQHKWRTLASDYYKITFDGETMLFRPTKGSMGSSFFDYFPVEHVSYPKEWDEALKSWATDADIKSYHSKQRDKLRLPDSNHLLFFVSERMPGLAEFMEKFVLTSPQQQKAYRDFVSQISNRYAARSKFWKRKFDNSVEYDTTPQERMIHRQAIKKLRPLGRGPLRVLKTLRKAGVLKKKVYNKTAER